jgi:hypothetical protein
MKIPREFVPPSFEVMYIYPAHSYWSIRKIGPPIIDQEISIPPLPNVKGYQWWADAINVPDVHSRQDLGRGIRVAIIDTGVGPHTDLRVVDGTLCNPVSETK